LNSDTPVASALRKPGRRMLTSALQLGQLTSWPTRSSSARKLCPQWGQVMLISVRQFGRGTAPSRRPGTVPTDCQSPFPSSGRQSVSFVIFDRKSISTIWGLSYGPSSFSSIQRRYFIMSGIAYYAVRCLNLTGVNGAWGWVCVL
jgi:hypothetical protein